MSSSRAYGNGLAEIDVREIEGPGPDPGRLPHDRRSGARWPGEAHRLQRDAGEVVDQRPEALNHESFRLRFVSAFRSPPGETRALSTG